MVERYNLSNCPLIFPKLTAYLISKNINIRVSGKMGSDYRVNEIIVRALLTKEWEKFPDVSYYDKRQQNWIDLAFLSTETIINLSRQGEICYSKQMYELQDERELSALCDYLRLNSSGSITTDFSTMRAI